MLLKKVAHRREQRFRPFGFNLMSGVIYERVITVSEQLDIQASRFRGKDLVFCAEQDERRCLYVSELTVQRDRGRSRSVRSIRRAGGLWVR